MEVIYENTDFKYKKDGVICALGFFDGIHIGHQKLITKMIEISKLLGLKNMIFTFDKHPMAVLDCKNAPKLIMNNNMKADILENLGVDIVNFNHVDLDFLNLKPQDFLTEILLKKFNVKAIIAGFNFRFGSHAAGNSKMLEDFGRENGIIVDIEKPVYLDGALVSSTTIRNLISEGSIETANKFLGRCYSLEGTVIHGMQRGRKIGFPTANIQIDDNLIVPKRGVYITKVELDGDVKEGITNIGFNPTFNNNDISIETHIIGSKEDLYGKHIKLYFYHRIRDEIAFKNADELYDQISRDKYAAIKYFENLKKGVFQSLKAEI